jgi:2-keto-3-deoxy-L-rhamnonate aldolase RhmA
MKKIVGTAMAGAVLAVLAQAQTEWENPVKKTLREGKPVVGMTVSIPSPDAALQAARLGFDFLWIEMEHSAITLESARNIILATHGTGTVPFIRVPVNELWTAKRALDIGALGVIFPFVSTPELAQRAVAACKYPPLGRRGSGPGLATLRWPAPGGYSDFADKNAMVIIIIEQKEAVERIEEIVAVPGIDVVFIGPNDLSYSYGFRGRQEPVVMEAQAKVLAAAQRRNITVGRLAGGAELAGYIKQGYQFFQTSTELNFMAAGARPLLQSLGKTGFDPKTRPLY